MHCKDSGFTRGVCKNRGFYYISRFSCGISREKAFSPKRGLFFAVKGASAPPPPNPKLQPRPLAPPPPSPKRGRWGVVLKITGGGGVFQEKGGGEGPGLSTGNLGVGGGGEGRGPFYREKEPPFRRKRLRTGAPEKIKNFQKIAREVDSSEPRLLQCA